MPGRQLCLTVLAAAILAGDAHASIGLFFSPPGHLTLRIDAAGNAEVSWSAKGRGQTMLIPPRGYYHAGRTLPGPDVSVAAPGVALPYRKAVRRTPDGRYWALQAWQSSFGGKVELRFSRWTGAPTKIELSFQDRGAYRLLVGKATFHGKPVTGTYRTNAGTLVPLAAQLDCFACPAAHGAHWYRFNGVRTSPSGTFGSGLQAAWQGARFRASISGPNIGWTLAPDAAASLGAG